MQAALALATSVVMKCYARLVALYESIQLC